MNTAASRPSPFVTTEGLEAALAAMKALGPPLPEIEFFEAFGDVVVVARRGNVREPLGRMTRGQFEELKARLRAGEGAR